MNDPADQLRSQIQSLAQRARILEEGLLMALWMGDREDNLHPADRLSKLHQLMSLVEMDPTLRTRILARWKGTDTSNTISLSVKV